MFLDKKVFFCVICIVFCLGAHAQSYYTYVSSTSSFDATAFNNSHKIACADVSLPGDSIHIVFHSQDSVFYTYSVDWGYTWANPLLLARGRFPGIDIDLSGFRHVVWQSLDTLTGNYEIFYDCLDDYAPPLNISGTPNNSTLPDVVVDSSLVAHIVWVEDIGYNHIYYRSCQTGVPGDTIRLSTYGTAEAEHTLPSISIFEPNQRIYVLWDCYDPLCYSPYQIHMRYKENTTWSPFQVWASYARIEHSSIDYGHGEDEFSAAWEDSSSGNLEAFFYGGNSGGGYPTYGSSIYPVVTTINTTWSYLFWQEDSAGFVDIYYNLYYFIHGWSSSTIRTDFNIQEPVRFPSGCGAFVIWTQGDTSYYPYDIYFANFDYPVSIFETDNKKAASQLRIRPNPFTHTTQIMPNHDLSTIGLDLKIFNVSGILVKDYPMLSGKDLSMITWSGDDNNGNQLSAGVYFIKLKTRDQEIVKKVVKLQ